MEDSNDAKVRPAVGRVRRVRNSFFARPWGHRDSASSSQVPTSLLDPALRSQAPSTSGKHAVHRHQIRRVKSDRISQPPAPAFRPSNDRNGPTTRSPRQRRPRQRLPAPARPQRSLDRLDSPALLALWTAFDDRPFPPLERPPHDARPPSPSADWTAPRSAHADYSPRRLREHRRVQL